MSTTTPTSDAAAQQLALQTRRADSYSNFSRNISWGLVVIGPVLILMPPRKLDVYTLLLGAGTILSANHLRTVYFSGNSQPGKPGWLSEKMDGMTTSKMPTEKARQVQALMKEKMEKERAERDREALEEKGIAERIRGFVEEAWDERSDKKKANEERAESARPTAKTAGVSEAIEAKHAMQEIKTEVAANPASVKTPQKGEWSEDWKEREKAEVKKKGWW